MGSLDDEVVLSVFNKEMLLGEELMGEVELAHILGSAYNVVEMSDTSWKSEAAPK